MPGTRNLLAGIALLGLVAAGCGGDDGGSVRELEGGGGSPGTGSQTGSGAGSASGTGSAAGAGVPEGVAAQYRQLAKEIKAKGGEKTSGPWRVGYVVEPAESWFVAAEGDYRLRAPAPGETHHIEIIPVEASTGRIVPDVPIRLEVVGPDGKVVDAKDLDFYYSEFFHYAGNFSVPQPGSYTLRATLEPPRFLRHGEQAEEPALAEGARVEFTGVQLRPA